MRRNGKSYAHPLIVLITLPNEGEHSRFGVAAGRTVGKAVKRNRAKRMMREALRPMISDISPGWDVLIIARQKILEASLAQIQNALEGLFQRADLYIELPDHE